MVWLAGEHLVAIGVENRQWTLPNRTVTKHRFTSGNYQICCHYIHGLQFVRDNYHSHCARILIRIVLYTKFLVFAYSSN